MRASRRAAASALLLSTVLACGCAPERVEAPDEAGTEQVVIPELGRFFADFGAEGAFSVYEAAYDRHIRYNPERCAERFLPASTFKIFNALVALDEGVLTGADHVLPWDGIERWNDAWNEDQDLATAFRRSTVPYFQEVARRVGPERMRGALEREAYGNADMSGGIDQFWLTGGLRISPDEQVAFLRNLDEGQSGFSEQAVKVVRTIMILETTNDYVLRAKTGWGELDGRQIGWLVGSVEGLEGVSYFALNLESADPAFPMVEARRTIANSILEDLGLL